MRVKTQDGPITIDGWAIFTESGERQTKLTIGAEFPGVDAAMADRIRPLMERSAANIKHLIETET